MFKYFTKHWIQGIIAAFIILAIANIGLNLIGTGAKMVNNGINTAYDQFNPKEILRKYEWFKDSAAQLTAKRNSLQVLNTKIVPLRSMNRKDMDRTDKTQLAQWEAELAGLAMSYNSLAAEYNSQLSKFNWRSFVGDLPKGASDVMSQQFAPYVTSTK